jgi:hypothetical protein
MDCGGNAAALAGYAEPMLQHADCRKAKAPPMAAHSKISPLLAPEALFEAAWRSKRGPVLNKTD